MNDTQPSSSAFSPADLFAGKAKDQTAVPVWFIDQAVDAADIAGFTPAQRRWLASVGFEGGAKKIAAVPAADGSLAAIVLGTGDGRAGEPSGPSALLAGQVAQTVPPGTYRLANAGEDAGLAALAWGLGGYRYRAYKGAAPTPAPRLVVPRGVDRSSLVNTLEAVWLARDLINTPASDMGPAEIETAVRGLAERHGASVSAVIGEELLAQGFFMLHAVGRASQRAPRLLDLCWGRADAPRVTVVGKGIAFDTGGLDIKPSNAMLLMKKDMAGAAAALALGHMIMGQNLDVRLRILIPAAENSISANAFRPGDVLRSRAGVTVEVGNTDAEGRLVLADALALADEEAPDTVVVFATLTGAARVALGPDVPALFTDDDALAAALAATGSRIGDPVWRLPLWPGYQRSLDSEVADMGNVWDQPFAGAVIAALFLKRFVKRARRFVHLDIYGWRPTARPLGPKGGEPQGARAVFELLRQERKQ